MKAGELDQGPIAEDVRKRYVLIVWLALAALPGISAAQAIYTATAGMPVRMEIVASCSVSASDLNFGAYASNQSTPVQGQTAIQLLCGTGTLAEVSLDAGTGPGGSTL